MKVTNASSKLLKNAEIPDNIFEPSVMLEKSVKNELVAAVCTEIRRRLDVMRTFPWLDYIKNPEEFIKDIQSLLTFAQSSRLAAF